MLTKEDLSEIDKRIDRIVKNRLDLFEKRITKKLNILISYFEKKHFSLEGRVTRIEKHLNLN